MELSRLPPHRARTRRKSRLFYLRTCGVPLLDGRVGIYHPSDSSTSDSHLRPLFPRCLAPRPPTFPHSTPIFNNGSSSPLTPHSPLPLPTCTFVETTHTVISLTETSSQPAHRCWTRQTESCYAAESRSLQMVAEHGSTSRSHRRRY